MSFVRKLGEFYFVCHEPVRHGRSKSDKAYKTYRDWWLVKTQVGNNSFCGKVDISSIIFPQEFEGKRIRLKVELVDDSPEFEEEGL